MWKYSSNKPWGSTLKDWCLHDPSATLSNEEWDFFNAVKPGCRPAMITGEVVEDDLLRWPPGQSIHTTMIVYLSLPEMVAETENTLYRLQGPGRFSNTTPKNIDNEVRITKILLRDPKAENHEQSSTKGFFHPVVEASDSI